MTKSDPPAAAAPGTPSASTSSAKTTGAGVSTTPGAAGAPTPAVTPGAPTAGPSQAATLPKATPKDAQVITAILKDLGITDYEPRIVHQLLEFAYRYITTVLEDAQVFSTYSKKKNIDNEDVRLAVQMQVDKMFTSPPPRDIVSEIARIKNNIPLPPIKSHAGPRLPPDRYSLIACNFKMKRADQINPPTVATPSTLMTPPMIRGSSTPTGRLQVGAIPFQQRVPQFVGNRVILTPVGESATGTKRKLEDS